MPDKPIDLIVALGRAAGEVLYETLTDDEDLRKRIEAELQRHGRKVLGRQYKGKISDVERVIGILGKVVDRSRIFVTSEARSGFAKNANTNTYDPYAVLGLSKSAPWEVVQAAYRALATIHHPDRNGGNQAIMQRINEAYSQIKKDQNK